LLPPFLARIDAIIGCDWPSMARINLFTIKVSLSHYLLCEVLFPCYCYFNFLLVHFFALGLGLPFGLCVCWIMQIKWHISMSVAILLLQFSSLTPFQNAINVSRRGRRLSCRPFNSRKANRKVAINPAKGLQLDLVNLKFNCIDRFICHT